MSISGKCDFGDTCEIFGINNIIKNYDVYVYPNDIIPLKITSEKDLIAYYPYLVSLMCKDKNSGTIILSEKSFIDSEEKDWLTIIMNNVIKYYKKCKRKKVDFDKQEAIKLIVWPINDEPEDYQIEIVNRVAKYGDKATLDGLHDRIHERMRDEWYQMMVDAGWDKNKAHIWVYGFRGMLNNDNNSEK